MSTAEEKRASGSSSASSSSDYGVDDEQCAASVIRSIRAQRHSRLNYSLGGVTPHNFPSPPPTATAGLPPPAPHGSGTNSKKAAFADPAVAAPPPAPVYIHSLQQLNTIVKEANSKSRIQREQQDQLDLAMAAYRPAAPAEKRAGSGSSVASDNSDSDDDGHQRKSPGGAVSDRKQKNSPSYVDSDEDLQDSGDDAELFRDFTAPTTGSSSSSSSASGRGPNYADGSAPIKSRIRGLQDLSRTKDSLSTKDSFGGGSGTSTTMIKPGQTIRVRASGKSSKRK